MRTGKYVLCLKQVARATNNKTIVLITNSNRICITHYLCVGTISRGLLRSKIEMHMMFENRLYLDLSNFILEAGLSYFRVLTICLLLVYFVSAAGCHCFDL